MKSVTPILIFFFSLSLISCSRNKLPVISDPETLHKDCVILFQQFPVMADTNHLVILESRNPNETVNAIPKNDWPPSIQNLKPFLVKHDNFGIYIWVKTNNSPTETVSGNWIAKGYFVSCTNFSQLWIKSNVPWFKNIGLPRIYEVSEPARVD